MIKQIHGEEPFQIINNGFSVSPSNEGYVLEYSTDGHSFTAWEDPVPSGENLVVTGLPLLPTFFRLKGNQSTVTLNY